MPERGGPQPLVLIFGEFEQKQVVFFSARAINPFKLAIRIQRVCRNLLRKVDIEGNTRLPGKTRKQRSEFGVLLFQKRLQVVPALLTISGNPISRESDGNDRGQDRYPKDRPAIGLQSKDSGFLLKRDVARDSANLTADSMLPILKQAPTNLA